MFTRRSFLGGLAALLGLGRASAAPPEVLSEAPAAPPEPKDPGWGPTVMLHHVHDWIPAPTTVRGEAILEADLQVEVCSHPDCYSRKVYREDKATGAASVDVVNYAVGELPGAILSIRFLHRDFMEMSRHIVAFIDKTGAELLVADDPMTRRIGFMAVLGGAPELDPIFEIPLTMLKNLNSEEPRIKLIRSYLPTNEGRIRLAAAMRGAGLARRNERLGLT